MNRTEYINYVARKLEHILDKLEYLAGQWQNPPQLPPDAEWVENTAQDIALYFRYMLSLYDYVLKGRLDDIEFKNILNYDNEDKIIKYICSCKIPDGFKMIFIKYILILKGIEEFDTFKKSVYKLFSINL